MHLICLLAVACNRITLDKRNHIVFLVQRCILSLYAAARMQFKDNITHIQSIIVVSSNLAANIRKRMSKSVRSSVIVPPRATNSPSLTLHCLYPKVTLISRCRDNGQAPFTSSAPIPSSSSCCQSLRPGHHHAETAGVTRPTPALRDRSPSTTNTAVSGVEEQQETSLMI